ncbi:restriction endonuclease subunit S [Methanospirillum sp.]|uniref:restriction endonuclease subunit S n=1 Tax=Methanospirillum sp. TaxID=45200 RepID=UPI0035A1C9B3
MSSHCHRTWSNGKLQDLVFFQRGFDITKAEQKEGDIPVISSSGVTSYHSEAKVSGPGIIIGRKGSLGTVHYSEGPYWPHDTTLWSKDIKGNNPRYIYYFLKTLGLERFDVGNSNPTLNRNHIHDMVIKIPSKDIQQKIVEILTPYDDLIENNRRRIQLLEEAARLLYQEWFVRLRFPGHEHTKIVDGVPEGWKSVHLHDVANITMGQSPASSYYNHDGIGLPFHQGVRDYGNRFPTNTTYCSKEFRIAEAGDILFSVRAPVGRINITLDRIVIGRGLASIRSKANCQEFLFYCLKNIFFKDDLMGTGAIYAAITKKELTEYCLLYPSNLIIESFIEYVKPIDQMIISLHMSNRNLINSRDLLLPRLMNGVIPV